MKRGLYQFFWDCGRSGVVEGLFIALDSDIANAIGKQVYFGEILGKHSEVYGTLTDGDVTLVTTDETVLNIIENAIGGKNISGYNPLECVSDTDEEENEDE